MKLSTARVSVAAVAIGGCLLACPGAAGAQGIATPPNCNSSYNPYDYTQAALSACGIATSTQTTAVPLAGGGTRYDYTLPNGEGVAHVYVPPDGFDFASATEAQLLQYGIPPAPTSDGIQAVENWQAFVSTLKHPQPAPAFLASGKATADVVSNDHWSGYAVNPSGTSFVSSIAEWTEPSYGPSACTRNSAVIWTGIGGYQDDDLGQDGTSWSTNGQTGLAKHQAWWEALPQVPTIQALNLIVSGTDEAQTITDWVADDSEYYGVVGDANTGDYQPWTYPGTFSGSSGEAIAERPLYSDGFEDLSNFHTLAFTTTEENYKYTNDFSATDGRHGIYMWDEANDLLGTHPPGATLMAEPDTVTTDGAFNDAQMSCQ